MHSSQNNCDRTEWTTRHLRLALFGIFLLGVVATILVGGFYLFHFPNPISSAHSTWGEFGDFLGGTLNPVFGFLGLMALLLTLWVQSRELAISSRELKTSADALSEQSKTLKLQSFENTFFALVNLHHELVRGIALRGKESSVTRGRDCIDILYGEHFRPQFAAAQQNIFAGDHLAIVEEAYRRFYDKYQNELGHYFRTLYRVFKFIDESEVEKKLQYAGIMRAQLSTSELALLFYNGLVPTGAKFKSLIEKFHLLENMPVSHLTNPPDQVPLYEQAAFGSQDVASYYPET